MENINTNQLIRLFPPNKSTITQGDFRRTQGWMTNGYFAIQEKFEPKSSKSLRFIESEVDINKTVEAAKERLKSGKYRVAEIVNHFELQGTMIVKLHAKENGKAVAWCNPRFLSYVLQGCQFMRQIKIMIGDSYNDPILVVTEQRSPDDEVIVLGLVMPVRKED